LWQVNDHRNQSRRYRGLKRPVFIAMAKQKTIPEVRIIEGLDQ
jgi:hypothetical protein